MNRSEKQSRTTGKPFLVAITMAVFAVSLVPTLTQSLVIGGTNVIPHRWGFIVSVKNVTTGRVVCGAALLNSRAIICSRDCVRGGKADFDKIFFRFGCHSHNNCEGDLHIEDMVTYNIDDGRHDIVLLRTKERIRRFGGNRHVVPILLVASTPDYEVGEGLRFVGWGSKNFDNKGSTELDHELVPNETFLNVQDEAECRKHYPNYDNNSQFCAGAAGKAVCEGEAGGPLFRSLSNQQSELVGVAIDVNLNGTCRNGPSLFARVHKYKFWIENTIKDWEGQNDWIW